MVATSMLEAVVGISVMSLVATTSLSAIHTAVRINRSAVNFSKQLTDFRQAEQLLDDALLSASSRGSLSIEIDRDGRSAVIRSDRNDDGRIDENSREKTSLVLGPSRSRGVGADRLRLLLGFGRQRMAILDGLAASCEIIGFDENGRPSSDPTQTRRLELRLARTGSYQQMISSGPP
jgi:hypothetical protein